MYSNLLQNCRGGSTLKEKFSSSRCQRDKNYLFEGSLPPPFMQIPSKKSSRRLVAHETKRYFFEGTLLGVHHQKNVLVVSLPTRQRDISLWVNYFCRLILGGSKIVYNKSLPVNFVRMFKINTRKLWQIKTNKQWVINTN